MKAECPSTRGLRNALMPNPSQHLEPYHLLPQEEKKKKKILHSVIGSWQRVKHSLSVPDTAKEALWPAVHLENLFFKHNQACKGKRQKATILTWKAWRLSEGFVSRDLRQWGAETIAKLMLPQSNPPPWSVTKTLFPSPNKNLGRKRKKYWPAWLTPCVWVDVTRNAGEKQPPGFLDQGPKGY